MKRRDMLKIGAATPAAALGQGHAHSGAAAKPAGVSWKPALFDEHQHRTAAALAEVSIPGAAAAGVVRHLDKALHDGPAEARGDFVAGLGLLDGSAIRAQGKPFVELTAAQQVSLVESLQETDFFRSAKSLISKLFYATEAGYRELNRGGRVPSGVGCPE